MEFSFGTKRWMKREWKEDEEVAKGEEEEADGYSLGLHAPGFFDKVLHVETCLLQSEPADKLFKKVGRIRLLASRLTMSTSMLAFSSIL